MSAGVNSALSYASNKQAKDTKPDSPTAPTPPKYPTNSRSSKPSINRCDYRSVGLGHNIS